MQLLEDLTEDLKEGPVADDADDLVGVAVGGDAVCCGDVLVHGVPEREATYIVLRAVTLCTPPGTLIMSKQLKRRRKRFS